MSQPVENIEKYDIRVIQRYLREGTLDRATYEAWLASLPDDSEHCTETETRFTPGESGHEEQDS